MPGASAVPARVPKMLCAAAALLVMLQRRRPEAALRYVQELARLACGQLRKRVGDRLLAEGWNCAPGVG